MIYKDDKDGVREVRDVDLKYEYKRFDVILAAFAVGLAIFGVFLIHSATKGASGLSRDARSQIMWVSTGIAVLFTFAFVDFRFICKFYKAYYVVNIVLLVLVIVLGFASGEDISRSIRFKGFGIQPSEFSKIFMIIFLAKIVDRFRKELDKWRIIALITLAAAAPIILIAAQPSLSASMVTLFITIVALFVGRLKIKRFLAAILVIVPVVGFIYYDVNREDHIFIDKVLAPYQLTRVEEFLEPDAQSVTQTNQGIRAIGSGQLSGKGYGNSQVKVPFAENDFIFSVVGEEFGFIGSITVLSVIFLMIVKLMIIAARAEVFYAKVIVSSVAAMIAFQAFVHVGVNTGMLVNTGIAFPFLSAGGSSLWVSMAAVGLCINIGMTREKSIFE